MKKIPMPLIQVLILLTGLLVLFALLRFPMLEGRAEGLDLFSIYADPFILYAYAASVFFFIGLYQVYKLIKFRSLGQFFTPASARALKMIRLCAIIFGIMVAAAGVYIKLFHDPTDDPAGFLTLVLLATMVSGGVAFFALKFERKFNSQQ